MGIMPSAKSAAKMAQNPKIASAISGGLSALTGGAVSIPPEKIIQGAKMAETGMKMQQSMQQKKGKGKGKGKEEDIAQKVGNAFKL